MDLKWMIWGYPYFRKPPKGFFWHIWPLWPFEHGDFTQETLHALHELHVFDWVRWVSSHIFMYMLSLFTFNHLFVVVYIHIYNIYVYIKFGGTEKRPAKSRKIDDRIWIRMFNDGYILLSENEWIVPKTRVSTSHQTRGPPRVALYEKGVTL